MDNRNLGRRLALSVVLGALVMAALGVFTDLRQVGSSFATFRYSMLLPVLLWTIFNYVLRWMREPVRQRIALYVGYGHGRHTRQGG